MGVDICHNKNRKGSVQVVQQPGRLPKAVGQALQVSGQRNQLHLQPDGDKEIVHESHQLATFVPFPDDPEDEASWPGGQNYCGCRDSNG